MKVSQSLKFKIKLWLTVKTALRLIIRINRKLLMVIAI